MNLRRTNKWWRFGLVAVVIGLIINIAQGNEGAIVWVIATFAWMVCAEMMRQQNERDQEFIQELLRERAFIVLHDPFKKECP